MLFDATCPSCGAAQRMNSIYAGTSRVCKTCHASFVLALPADVRTALEQRRPNKPSPHAVMVTCEACLETFSSPVDPDGAPVGGDPHRASGAVQCRSCGGRCAAAGDVRARLDAAEKALLQALLAGADPAAATEQLVAPSWTATVAARVRARCQRDLPFVRAYIWEAVLEGLTEARMAPPPLCDLCARRPIDGPRPLDATWRRVTTGSTSVSPLSALTLFSGAIVLRRERTVETLRALYFLCGECHRELGRLLRGYRGYPASVGYELDALRRL